MQSRAHLEMSRWTAAQNPKSEFSWAIIAPPYHLVVPPYNLVVPPYNLVVPHLISSRFVGAISPPLRPGPTSAYFCLDNSPGTPHPFVMCHAHHGRGAVDSAFVMCHAHHGRGAVYSGQAAGVE